MNISVPQAIKVEDPCYHERDLRLTWDPAVVKQKLGWAMFCAQVHMRADIKRYVQSRTVDIKGTEREKGICCQSLYKQSRWVGAATSQNQREYMEDEACAGFAGFTLPNGDNVQLESFAVFDGHGGKESAIYAQEHLTRHLVQEIIQMNPDGLTDPGMRNAFKAAFVHLDEAMKGAIKEDSGCAAVLCVKIGKELWTANVGDCRAVVRVGDEVIQLSEDARPSPPLSLPNRFTTSIIKRGGTVVKGRRCSRVNGRMSLARALNDKTIKSVDPSLRPCHPEIQKDQFYVMVPRPKITKYDLPDTGAPVRLLLASDGVWGVLSSKKVGDILAEKTPVEKLASRVAEAALAVVDKHGNFRCGDNITVLVTDLTNSEKRKL